MSSSNTPLSGNALTPLQRVSLNSAITNVVLDSDSGNSSLVIRTGTTNSLYIDKNSNVGINTNNPTAQLEVASGNGACLRLRYGSSTTAYANLFTTSVGDLAISANSGSVNINSAVNIVGNLTLAGTLTLSGGSNIASSLGVIDVSSAGTAVASKALIVDNNRSIVNINNIGVSSIQIGSSMISATDASRLSGLSIGTGVASKVLVLDSLGSVSGITSLSAQSLSGVLQTSSQPNIQLVGTLSSLNVGGSVVISSTNDAVSTTNGGALTIGGGLAVAKNVYIGGNLYVNGSTTSVNSTNITIADNAIVLNASPSAPRDSGVLIQRYQTNNDVSAGTVITDTPALTLTATAATTLTITLSIGASNVNDFYNGWWILVNTQSRKVIAYDGTNRVITVESGFTIVPTVGSSVKLYNKSYATVIWDESENTFHCAYASSDPTTTYVYSGDASFQAGSIIGSTITTSDTTDSTSSTTGALKVSGGVGVAKSIWAGTGFYGTIKTPVQTEITTLGTLSTLTVSDTTTTGAANINLISNLSGAIGINGSSAATNPSTFYLAYNGSNRLLIDSSGNVAIGSSSFGYKLSVGGSINASSISIGGTSLATNLISGSITSGLAVSGKVLTVDSNLDITGINNLTLTSSLKIGSLSFGSTELGYLTSLTIGSAVSGKVLVPDSNKAISGLTSIVLNNPSPSGVVSQTYSSDAQSFISGVQGSGTSISASSYYWYYNGAYRLFMNTAGNIAIGISTVDANTFNYKLNVSGSLNASSYYVNGALINLDIIQGPTPGVASASRALVVDSSLNITNINSITVSNLKIGSNTMTTTELGYITGISAGIASAGKALIVDSSNNISGIGSLSAASMTVGGQPVLTSTSGSFAYIQNITEGTASASKSLVTDSNKDIGGIRRIGISDTTTTGGGMLTIASNSNSLIIGARGSANTSGADLAYISYGGSDRLIMNANGNIAIGTTSVSTYKLNVSGSINATSFYLNGSQLTLDNLSFLSGTVAGTAIAGKALVLDSSSNIASINSLTSDKLVASTSLTVGSNTISYEVGYLAGTSQGTATNGKALVLNTSGSISGINNIGATSITLGSASLTATTAGYLSGITLAGSAVAGKALTTDTNNSVSGINNISAQSLTLNGAVLTSSLFDAINGITAGQITPSKALIFDSTGSLSFGTSKITFANSMFTLTTSQTSNTDYTVFQRWINDVSTDVIADISVSNLAFRFGTYSNHALRLMTNNSTKVYIDTLGNVGIGDITPSYMLDVAGTIRGSQLSTYSPSSGTITSSSTIGSYGLILGTSSGTTGIQSQSAIAFVNNTTAQSTATPNAAIALECVNSNTGNLIFYTNSSTTGTGAINECMRISANGNIGIGNNTPAYQLDLNNSASGINTPSIRYDTSNSASPAIGAMIVTPTSITPSIAVSNTLIARTSSDQLVVVPSAAPTSTAFLLYANSPTSATYTAIALSGAALTNFTPATGLTCVINAVWISPTNTIWVGGTLTKTGYSKPFLFSGTTAGITTSYIHSLASSTTANLGVIGISGASDTSLVCLVQNATTTANIYYTTNGTSFVNTGAGAASTYTSIYYIPQLAKYVISTTASSLFYCPVPVSSVVLTACTTPSSTAAISSVCYNPIIGAAFAFGSSLVWTSTDGITWTSRNTASGNVCVVNDTTNGGVVVIRAAAMIYYTSVSSSITYPVAQVFAASTNLNTIITTDSANRIFGFTSSAPTLVQYITLYPPSYYTNYSQTGYLTHGGNYGYKWYYGSSDPSLNLRLLSIDPVLGLKIGNTDSTCANTITFGGTAGDAGTDSSNNYYTVISERIYANTEDSELLLFKGNDAPDRIRYYAPQHIFQIGNDSYNTMGDTNTILAITNSGKVGIRNTAPVCPLHISAIAGSGTDWVNIQRWDYNGSSISEYQVRNDNGDAVIGTTSTNSFSLMTVNTRRLYISTAGNVGVGTNSPSYKLDVSGDINVSGTYKMDGDTIIDASKICYVSKIAVNTPTITSGYMMDLNGSLRIGSYTATSSISAPYGVLNAAGASKQTTASSGFIALNVTSGRILCADEIDAYSDIRIKRDIQPLEIGFVKQFMRNANPVKYKYKKYESATYSYGFIAQDFVKRDYTDLYKIESEPDAEELIDEDGFVSPKDKLFSICYNSIIPMLTLSQKDTYNEVDELKAKVSSLEERLAKLEALLENK
jgi:Chaperone of endosialidase